MTEAARARAEVALARTRLLESAGAVRGAVRARLDVRRPLQRGAWWLLLAAFTVGLLAGRTRAGD